MSAIRFVIPSPEDIFMKWLDTLSDSKFRDFFVQRGARISRNQVSPAENIEDIRRHAIILAFIKVKVQGRLEERRVRVSQLKKIEFYDYEVLKSVPIFKTIAKVSCEACSGTGVIKCARCDGTGKRKCSYCGGTGHIKCPECDGKGTIEISIKVWTSKDKKEKKKINVIGPKCHGTGKIICRECHGVGKVPCSDCGGSGKISCSKCEGHGHLIRFKVGVIGSREKTMRYIAPKMLLKSKLLKQSLEHLSRVGFLKLTNILEIDQEKISKIIGYELENLKEAKRELSSLLDKLRKNMKVVSVSIRLYPVIELKIKTIKNKKALIAGIGSADNFVVVQLS